MKVLIADDEPIARERLRALVAEYPDLTVVGEAGDGAAALHACAEHAPDLVLLDIAMPGMDGFAVARTLRSQPELRDIRVVALTGFGQQDDRRKSREAGFDDHLVKPVSPDELRRLLAS